MDSPKAAHHTEAGGGSLLVSVNETHFAWVSEKPTMRPLGP